MFETESCTYTMPKAIAKGINDVYRYRGRLLQKFFIRDYIQTKINAFHSM